jgi:adenylate cyclase
MSIKDFLNEADDEVATIISSDFKIEVTNTDWVPGFDDPTITYDNLDDQVKRCKLLESCVLYVDIRNSATISAERQPHTLARVYSAFVRTMIKSVRHFGGHVRNIIGDRVMVVFDKKDCFPKAVRTGILCQTVAQRIIDRRITTFDFRCGVGIDYGKMLIVKAGAVRRGAEMEFYRSLVWLGRPANVASKLTDVANKVAQRTSSGGVSVIHYYPYTDKWLTLSQGYREFVLALESNRLGGVTHKDRYVRHFYDNPPATSSYTPKPILVTKAVYDGYRAAVGAEAIEREGWATQSVTVPGYAGAVYGSAATYNV